MASLRSEATSWEDYPIDTNTLFATTGQVHELTEAWFQRQDVTTNSRTEWIITSTRWTNTVDQVVTNDGIVSTNKLPDLFTVVETNVYPLHLIGGFQLGVANAPITNGPLPALLNSMRRDDPDIQEFVDNTQMDTNEAAEFFLWTVSNLVDQAGGIGGVGVDVGADNVFREDRGVFRHGVGDMIFFAMAFDGSTWEDLGPDVIVRTWGNQSFSLNMWLTSSNHIGILDNVTLPVMRVVHDADPTTTNNIKLSLTGITSTGFQSEDTTLDYSGVDVELTNMYWGDFLAANGIQFDFTVVSNTGLADVGDQIAVMYTNFNIWVPHTASPTFASTQWLNSVHLMINNMRWTRTDVMWSALGESNNATGSGSTNTFAAADAIVVTNIAPDAIQNLPPLQTTTHTTEFNSSAQTRYAYATASGVFTGLPHIFELWVSTEGIGTFTNNGTIDVRTNDLWSLVYTSSVVTVSGITSPAIGDFSLAAGTFPPAVSNTSIGYSITNAEWLIRWDVPTTDFIVNN